MKYLYVCEHCGETWKQIKNSVKEMYSEDDSVDVILCEKIKANY